MKPEYFDTALRHSFEARITNLSEEDIVDFFTEPSQLIEADRALNRITIRFLGSGDWAFAEMVADFHVHIPEKLRGSGEDYYFAIVNRAIAQKFAGKEYKSGLKGPAWGAFHPSFTSSLEVLDDEFGKAEQTMRNQAVKEAIGLTGFRTWPLFKSFAARVRSWLQENVQCKVCAPDPESDVADLEKAVSGRTSGRNPTKRRRRNKDKIVVITRGGF